MVMRTRRAGAAAPARVLHGPATLTAEQLRAVYDLLEDDVPGTGLREHGPTAGPTLPDGLRPELGDPAQRDLDWYAWCAEQVAAGTEVAVMDGPTGQVAASGRAHWHWQAAFAARRAAAEHAARAEVEGDRQERWAALGKFTTWYHDASSAARAAVDQARAEHAQITRSEELLDALGSARAAAGAGHADQWRLLADLALLHRAAAAPPGAPAGTFGIPVVAPAELLTGAGPGLTAAVDAVVADDLADLAVEDAPGAHSARISPVSQAGRDALEATFTADPDAADVLGGVSALAAQLSPVLGLAAATVASRIRLAPRVVWLLPHTLAALQAGTIEAPQLMVVAGETSTAGVSIARRLDEQLFGPGGTGLGDDGHPLGAVELREEVVRSLGILDAEAVRARSRRKTAARRDEFTALGDGQARWTFTGPALALRAARDRLTAVARRNRAEARQAAARGSVAADGGDPYAVPGVDVADPSDAGDLDALLADDRPLNAHRFDAGMRALGGVVPADGSSAPDVTVELQVGLPTLLDAGVAAGGEDPGWVEGVGSVPAWLCRQAGAWRGAVVRRLLVDPFTGDLVTVDGHTYPASWLRRPSGGSGDGDGPGGGSGPPGSPGPGPGGGSSTPTTFRGQPVQQLPPPQTVDDAFDPPLDEETLARLAEALAAGEVVGDPCADGLCLPVDPDDCPLRGVGGGPHDAPAALDRWVRARWGGCTGPGSRVRAGAADLDHVIAHRGAGSAVAAGGGSTCSCNLEPKSRFWHRVKHGTDPTSDRNPVDPTGGRVPWVRRWRQWRCDLGSSHWVSPLGTRHHSRPRVVGRGEGLLRQLHAAPYQVEALPRLVHRGDTDASVPDRPSF